MVAAPHNWEYNYIFLHILKRLKVQIRVVRLFLQKSKKKIRIIRKSTFLKNKQKRFDVKKLQDKKKKKTRLKVNLIQTNLKPYIYDPCIYIDYIQL